MKPHWRLQSCNERDLTRYCPPSTDLSLVENLPDCLADLVVLPVPAHHLLNVRQLPEVEIPLPLEALQAQPQLHQLEAQAVQRPGLVLTGRGGSPQTSTNKSINTQLIFDSLPVLAGVGGALPSDDCLVREGEGPVRACPPLSSTAE